MVFSVAVYYHFISSNIIIFILWLIVKLKFDYNGIKLYTDIDNEW